jgi:catechol 2,3-dioxygenase-like lactoylglutathione lyase family enzyme
MLAGCDVIAFVSTADGDRARRFYEATLGLPLLDESPYALAFDAHGTQLRVTVTDDVAPRPYTVLGWRVADIAAAVAELSGRGVAFLRYDGMGQDELAVWTSPSGARVAWFTDPDGNVLSLTEF